MKVLGFYFLATVSLSFGDNNKRILMTDATYVQQLEQRIQTLKANMADMTSKVADLSTKITAPGDVVQTLKANVADMTLKVADLTTKLAASDHTIQTLTSTVADLTTKIAVEGSGGSYVRWGRSSCPNNTSDLVYAGYAGASWWQDTGTAANYLCMTAEPEWQTDNHIVGFEHGPRIFGVEYYLPHSQSNAATFDDAPCAVCRSHQPTVVMIPGRRTCYPGWTTEYKGYIVAGNHGQKGSSQFVCLDEHPEPIPHGTNMDEGGFFEPTTSHCGSLTCPPYKENKIVMCVVCSK